MSLNMIRTHLGKFLLNHLQDLIISLLKKKETFLVEIHKIVYYLQVIEFNSH